MSKVRDARGAELSESAVLENVEALLEDAARLPVSGSWAREVREVLAQVHRLQGQVARRLHTNPGALVMYGNPPMTRARGGDPRIGDIIAGVRMVGIIAANVHEIRYDHAEDGKPYRHVFERNGTGAWAATWERHKVILMLNMDAPLWKDF